MKYDLNGTLEMYVKYQESNSLDKKKTINKYMTCIKEFLNEMNITTLEQIQELNWIEVKVNYINKLKNERGLSAQSINLRLTSIQSYFNVLEGLDILEKNIIKNIKKEVVHTKNTMIDKDQIKALVDEATREYEEKHDYLSIRNLFMIKLMVATGLRGLELRGIKVNDIDFSNGLFSVEGKYGKVREVCVPKSLMPLYREYLGYRNEMTYDYSDKLFVSKLGKDMNKNTPNDVVKKLCKQANIDNDIVAHTMRKAFGSLLIADGVELEQVSKLMGHSNSSVTSRIYTKQVKNSVKDIMEQHDVFDNIM